MKASAPRYGFRVYLSDAGYVCIEQQGDGPVKMLFHHDEIASLIEALEETKQKALDYAPPDDD